jgi:hypothetical protein
VQPDGVTLTSDSKAVIGKRIKDFAEWYATNDPAVLKHVIVMSRGSSWSYLKKTDERQGDWAWFANEFITFIQDGLASERAD